MGSIGERHSKQYLLKSATDELHEVASGVKPAALGFWTVSECCKAGVNWSYLHPTKGRYYSMAIAKSMPELDRLILAYYLPVCKVADVEVGLALGYSYSAITWYVNRMKYKRHKQPKGLKHFLLKTIATAQKMGWLSILAVFMCLIIRDKTVIHTLKKEKIL